MVTYDDIDNERIHELATKLRETMNVAAGLYNELVNKHGCSVTANFIPNGVPSQYKANVHVELTREYL